MSKNSDQNRYEGLHKSVTQIQRPHSKAAISAAHKSVISPVTYHHKVAPGSYKAVNALMFVNK